MRPMLFSCFPVLFPEVCGTEVCEARSCPSCPHLHGHIGLQGWDTGHPICELFFFFFFFFFSFFFFFWLLLFVPASVFWFLDRFWTGLVSRVRPARGPCPAPGGTAPAARPQHAPAMLENSLPFEPHPSLPPWLSNVLSPHVD